MKDTKNKFLFDFGRNVFDSIKEKFPTSLARWIESRLLNREASASELWRISDNFSIMKIRLPAAIYGRMSLSSTATDSSYHFLYDELLHFNQDKSFSLSLRALLLVSQLLQLVQRLTAIFHFSQKHTSCTEEREGKMGKFNL